MKIFVLKKHFRLIGALTSTIFVIFWIPIQELGMRDHASYSEFQNNVNLNSGSVTNQQNTDKIQTNKCSSATRFFL